VRYRSGYSHGASVERMYRKLRKYGAQALSHRELKLLRRESDLDQRNPARRLVAPFGSLRGYDLREHWKASQQETNRYTRPVVYTKMRRSALTPPGRLHRNPLSCRMSRQSMFHELKHHASRWRPQKQRVAIVLSTLRKCGRRNPHRDGRPTKGEQRRARRSGRYDFEPDYSPRYGRRRVRRNPSFEPDFTHHFKRGGRIELFNDGEVCVFDAMDRDMDDYYLKPHEVARLKKDVLEHQLGQWHHYTRDMVRDDYDFQGRGGREKRNPRGHRGHRNKRRFEHSSGRYLSRRQVHHRERRGSRRNPQRNPKRDGTPTRGELRKVKRSAYLKTIMQRGKDAEAILARIHAVPAASKAAVVEHAPAMAALAEQGLSAVATAGIEQKVEHAEAKFLRSRIDELGVLHADLVQQIESLGDDDLSADDAAMLQEQAVKIAKQRGLMRAKAKSLGIQTNPRPRGSHGRRVLVGLRAYGVALKRLHSAIRAR
jgi:hypothetical protein